VDLVKPIKPITIIDDEDAIVRDEVAALFLADVHPDSIDAIPGAPKPVQLSPRRRGRRWGDVKRCARERAAVSRRNENGPAPVRGRFLVVRAPEKARSTSIMEDEQHAQCAGRRLAKIRLSALQRRIPPGRTDRPAAEILRRRMP
jgi:hypothetical protein